MQVEHPADEIKRLQRCTNDLVSVLALPAMWSGAEPSRIVHTLLDALLGMLHLDFIYARLQGPVGEVPIEMARVGQSRELRTRPQEIGEVLRHCLGDDPQKWPPVVRSCFGDEAISILPLRLGLDGEIGVIVAGSQREDFPGPTEKLLLSVAANQAALGLQEARIRRQQNLLAAELDLQVAQRTADLAAAEERWRRSEAFLAEAQSLSSIGSFSWRVATGEITWSDELYRIYELEIGVPVTLELIRTRVHPEDVSLIDKMKMVDLARSGGNDFEWHWRLLMPDHSIKHLHAVSHATRDQDGQLEYVAAVQDVTARKLAEEARDKA